MRESRSRREARREGISGWRECINEPREDRLDTRYGIRQKRGEARYMMYELRETIYKTIEKRDETIYDIDLSVTDLVTESRGVK